MDNRRFQPWPIIDHYVEVTETIPETFMNTVKYAGNRTAHIFKDGNAWQTITYSEWDTISREIANALLALGVEVNDRNCIFAPTCAAWTWADIGNMMAGGTTVTIFPTLSNDEIAYIINHSEVKFAFVGTPEMLHHLKSLWPQLPTLQGIICLNGEYKGDGEKTWSLEEFRALGRSYASSHPYALDERISSLKGNDGATIIYTSGTTGKLKAARFTQKDCVWAIWRGLKMCAIGGTPITYDDVYFNVMPLAHVMERTYGYFLIIGAGGAMGFAQSPKTILEDIAYIRPTCMCWVPRMYERLLKGMETVFCSTPEGKAAWEWALEVGKKVVAARTNERGKINMIQDPLEILEGQLREDYLKAKELVFDKVRAVLGGRLRFCAVGGASLNPEIHLTWSALGFPMLNGWGLTETMCNGAVGYASAVKIGWNAPPCPGVDIKIAEDGEALIKAEGIITSYYNDPEANIGAFTEDGYFRTGDIIEMDEDGFIRIIDRKKAIVVLDTGKNVAPARIEAKVLENMLVDQIVVIGDKRKYITALIVPNWDIIINMFRAQGLPFDESQLVYEEINGLTTCVQVGPDIYDNPTVIQMIEQIVEKANNDLSDYERIKRFKILPRKLTQSRGELTPTQKIKTRVVMERFAEEIEQLYS